MQNLSICKKIQGAISCALYAQLVVEQLPLDILNFAETSLEKPAARACHVRV
jgi:hypothetical protein